MDAGAGTGVMQWYLAEEGAEVLSVDRGSRGDLPLRFRRRYQCPRVCARRTWHPLRQVIRARLGTVWRAYRRWGATCYALSGAASVSGRVIIYNQDLKTLADIPDTSLDAVVAVSALEHNTPESLPLVVAELMRVLKPGGLLLATLGAARDQDWFHEPSHGLELHRCQPATAIRLVPGNPIKLRQLR